MSDARVRRRQLPTGNTPLPGSVHAPDALATLGDDAIESVLHYLALLPRNDGSQWPEAGRVTCRNVAAFASSCALVARVFKSSKLFAEVRERRVCDVLPVRRNVEYPYLEQKRARKTSKHRMRFLLACEETMAFHCAARHCRESRNDACDAMAQRRSERNATLEAVVPYPTMRMSSARSGARAYAVVHVTRTSQGNALEVDYAAIVCLSGERWRIGDPMLRLDASMAATDITDLACSPTGRAAAYVAWNMDAVVGANGPRKWTGNRARVWVPDEGATYNLAPPDGDLAFPLIYGIRPIHPMLVLWRDARTLRVAWTTTPVDLCGHRIPSDTRVEEFEMYFVATYDCTDVVDGEMRVKSIEGPWSGRLLSLCAPHDGEGLVAMVRRRPLAKDELHYEARVHFYDRCGVYVTQVLRHPTIWNWRAPGPGGYGWGPVAVGIAPAGDAIVCVHVVNKRVIAEVFQLTTAWTYERVAARSLTEPFSPPEIDDGDVLHDLYGSDDDERDDLPLIDDHAEFEDAARRVQLSHSVTFTHCGSFAVIMDRRPLLGCRAPHYSTVMLQIEKRLSHTEIKAVPFFRERRSMPRSIACREEGWWVQAQRGVLWMTA